MKVKEIKQKFAQAKQLLGELSMVEYLLSSMLKMKKRYPEDYSFDEKYFESLTIRRNQIKTELENLFK